MFGTIGAGNLTLQALTRRAALRRVGSRGKLVFSEELGAYFASKETFFKLKCYLRRALRSPRSELKISGWRSLR